MLYCIRFFKELSLTIDIGHSAVRVSQGVSLAVAGPGIAALAGTALDKKGGMFMKRLLKSVFPPALMLSVVMILSNSTADAANVPTMTKEQLKARLLDANLVLIDVRTGRDWTSSEFKIQGARREDPANIESWVNRYAKDQTIVLYCA